MTEGDFARNLRDLTLRQFSSGSLGGSTERILFLQANGEFSYRENSQYDGGFVHGEPELGRWTASGDFPSGTLQLSWMSGEVTQHSIEYHGGDSCLIDGVPTRIG